MVERVEIQIREQGTDDRALRGALSTVHCASPSKMGCCRNASSKGEHPPVADLRRHRVPQRRVRDGVEIRLEVRIDDVAIARAQQRVDPPQRILGAAPGRKP